MSAKLATHGCERIGPTHPQTAEFVCQTRRQRERVFKGPRVAGAHHLTHGLGHATHCGLTHFPVRWSYVFTSFAGFPAITLNGGKLWLTTAFAPTTLLRPIVKSPAPHAITAPIPSQQFRSIRIRPPATARGA